MTKERRGFRMGNWLELFLTAGLLAVFMYRNEKLLFADWPIRVLFGVASTPFYISMCVCLVGILLPNAPNIISRWMPLCILFLWVIFSGTISHFVKFISNIQKKKHRKQKSLEWWILPALSVILLCRLVANIIEFYYAPLVNYDINQYVLEAKYYAEEPSIYARDKWKDGKEDTVEQDSHGVFWITYLAHGIMKIPEKTIEICNQPVIKSYLIMTLISMSAAFIGLSLIIKKSCFVLTVSFGALFYFHRIYGIYIGGDREGFRITAISMFLIIFLSIIKRRLTSTSLNDERNIEEYVMLFLASLFVGQSHGLGFLMLGISGIPAVILLLILHVPLKKILTYGFFYFLGAAVCFTRNVIMYFETGYFRFYRRILTQGTPLYSQSQPLGHSNFQEKMNSLFLFKEGIGNFILSMVIILGFIATLYAFLQGCIKLWKRKIKDTERLLFILSIVELFNLLPVLGVFDIKGYYFSDWFVQNERYNIYLYVIPLVMIVAYFSLFLTIYNQRLGKAIVYISVIMLFLGANIIINVNWPKDRKSHENIASQMRQVAKVGEDNIGDNEIILTNYLPINTYLKNPGKLIPSAYVYELIAEESLEEIEQLVKSKHIGAVIIHEDLTSGLEKTAFYQFLITSDKVKTIKIDAPYSPTVYCIHK